MITYNENEIVQMTQEQFQDTLVENTDRNYHSENVVYIAYRSGNRDCIERAEDILDQHLSLGHLSGELSEKRNILMKDLRGLFLPTYQETIWRCL